MAKLFVLGNQQEVEVLLSVGMRTRRTFLSQLHQWGKKLVSLVGKAKHELARSKWRSAPVSRFLRGSCHHRRMKLDHRLLAIFEFDDRDVVVDDEGRIDKQLCVGKLFA